MNLLLIPLFLFGVSIVAGQDHRIDVVNKCSDGLWVGTKSSSGDPDPEQGGFYLGSGGTKTLNVPYTWGGRIWPMTGCNAEGAQCATGDCGAVGGKCQGRTGAPPATLAEITFSAACCGRIDFYDVSLVDGYNVEMTFTPMPDTITPQGPGPYICKAAGCVSDLNDNCPAELRDIVNGKMVGCKSACAVFNTDRYCCRGAYGTPQTCPPFSYSEDFKKACPSAYSYAYDDKASTFTCRGNNGGASPSGYTVTFCP